MLSKPENPVWVNQDVSHFHLKVKLYFKKVLPVTSVSSLRQRYYRKYFVM
jgi:hypothetical protein